jgi:hypothetical protein
MTTRREWLTNNPPPRTIGNLRKLLDELRVQAATRTSLITTCKNRQDTSGWNHANSQIEEANKQIAYIDGQLPKTENVGKRIQETEKEIRDAVCCPTHSTDLVRHINRPEDMFTCSLGPHFFLWTIVNDRPALFPLGSMIAPGLEFPMTKEAKISRAEWLAYNRPPSNDDWPHDCVNHPGEKIFHLPEDRIDVYSCNKGCKWLWTVLPRRPSMPGKTLMNGFKPCESKKLPALEDPIE